MFQNLLLVGPGRCGLQLARSLAGRNLNVAAVLTRSRSSRDRVRQALPGTMTVSTTGVLPDNDVILIAVPDREIAAVARSLAPRLSGRERLAVHTSGLLPSDLLEPLAMRGLQVASFHPLLSFPTATGSLVPTAGALAAIEGEEGGVKLARRLARVLGMRPHRLAPEHKALYHAAAAMAGNLTHIAIWASRAELQRAGFSPSEAVRALTPLVRGAVDAALTAHGLEKLTGPISRGDSETIAAHLAVLPPSLGAAYQALAALVADRLRNPKDDAGKRLDGLPPSLTAHG